MYVMQDRRQFRRLKTSKMDEFTMDSHVRVRLFKKLIDKNEGLQYYTQSFTELLVKAANNTPSLGVFEQMGDFFWGRQGGEEGRVRVKTYLDKYYTGWGGEEDISTIVNMEKCNYYILYKCFAEIFEAEGEIEGLYLLYIYVSIFAYNDDELRQILSVFKNEEGTIENIEEEVKQNEAIKGIIKKYKEEIKRKDLEYQLDEM